MIQTLTSFLLTLLTVFLLIGLGYFFYETYSISLKPYSSQCDNKCDRKCDNHDDNSKSNNDGKCNNDEHNHDNHDRSQNKNEDEITHSGSPIINSINNEKDEHNENKENDDDDKENDDDESIDEMKEKEVFNISNNIFSYQDANAVCRAFGSKLATVDHVKKSYQEGANWCNYGWTDGQFALYPTQYASWEKLQKGPKNNRNDCGLPGINGGYFENPELKFGVNCYGVKPKPNRLEKSLMESSETNQPIQQTYEDVNFQNRVNHFKSKMDDIHLSPFKSKHWSVNEVDNN